MDGSKTTIDGFTFELHQLPAWDHAEASLKMMKIVGPAIKPLAKLFTSAKPGDLNLEVVGAIIGILREAPVRDVMDLAKQMLEGGSCIVGGDLDDGAGKLKLAPLMPIFDRVMRGKLMTIYKLIAWAVGVNFAGFFDDLKNALPAPPAPPQSQAGATSSSPSPSPLVVGGPAAG